MLANQWHFANTNAVSIIAHCYLIRNWIDLWIIPALWPLLMGVWSQCLSTDVTVLKYGRYSAKVRTLHHVQLNRTFALNNFLTFSWLGDNKTHIHNVFWNAIESCKRKLGYLQRKILKRRSLCPFVLMVLGPEFQHQEELSLVLKMPPQGILIRLLKAWAFEPSKAGLVIKHRGLLWSNKKLRLYSMTLSISLFERGQYYNNFCHFKLRQYFDALL